MAYDMGLQLGKWGVAVLVVMKVAYQEEREPSSWIGAYTIDKHEGGSKFVVPMEITSMDMEDEY